MKIDNDQKTSLLDSLVKATQSKQQKDPSVDKQNLGSSGTSYDKVELSTKKEQISTITEKVKAQPEVRQDKVEAMKEAIKNETYNVRGELVARSMMKSQLLDQLL